MRRKRINQFKSDDKAEFAGYPHYPGNEDIYKKATKVVPGNDIDNFVPVPENNKLETDVENLTPPIIESIVYPLDVPGSELDYKQEEIGSEDEENNYYSIGGDNHSD